MEEREKRLLQEPLKVDDIMPAGTITDPNRWVVARVNGNPMSNEERNRVASQLVDRWNNCDALAIALQKLISVAKADLASTLSDDCTEFKEQVARAELIYNKYSG